MWLSRTQTSAISEHANKTGHYPLWDKVKCIDRDPHWYSRRVEEAILRRLDPNNINRDSGIEIPESWMPTLRQHVNRPVPQRTANGSVSSSHNANNALDRNPPSLRFVMHQSLTMMVVEIAQLSKSTRVMKTCSVQLKRRDQYQSDNCETNNKTKPFIK